MTDSFDRNGARAVADMRRWVDTWRDAGAELEAERWARVAALSDDEAWEETVALLSLWEPTWVGDSGDELLRHQDVFAKIRLARST
jgi:hypothetical protein